MAELLIDQATLNRLNNRDAQLLHHLFETINPRMIRMLSSHRIYKEHAEELIHEAWETFFTQIEKYQGRSTVQTFIFGILINKIRENRRRLKKIDYEEDSQKVFDRNFSMNGWWSQDPTDPEKLAANKQLGSQIESCLEGLTDDQRNAFLLLELEGESSEQACNIMGVSVSNLRVLMYRAKDKLRQCLEGQMANT